MLILLLLIIVLVVLFYYYLLKPQTHWKRKNVKQNAPVPLFGDTIKTTFKQEAVCDFVRTVYNKFKNERYYGIYQSTIPTLVIRDPSLIKQLTVKDFDHFVDHISFITDESEPIWNKNLFSLKGEKWREMRATLSPTFTASKMRLMFDLMDKSAQQYVQFYLDQNKNIVGLELKESFSKVANDVIANCAFGVTVDSLKDPNNAFYLNGKKVTDFTGFWKNIKFFVMTLFPKLSLILNLRIFAPHTLLFFKTLVSNSVRVREEKNIIRPDMINLLMEARKGKLKYEESIEQKDAGFATVEESLIEKTKIVKKITMTDEDMAAQALIFFFAGFESVSNVMSFLCYELAINPDIQKKLQAEVDNVKHLTYDILNGMKYLDMVISENLRKNPATSLMDRMCTKPYTIQPQRPNESPVQIKVGDFVWLPVMGIHRDEQYYPNPDKFDPERFSDENKSNIQPYTYLPFGLGPRNCIGSRFALMELKTLIFYILRKFELVVIERTQIPMKYDHDQFTPAFQGGCWIGFKRRVSKLLPKLEALFFASSY